MVCLVIITYHGSYRNEEVSQLFTSLKENPLPRQIGAKNLASVVGRHFIYHSGREGDHSRLASAGRSGTGYIGKRAARQHRWPRFDFRAKLLSSFTKNCSYCCSISFRLYPENWPFTFHILRDIMKPCFAPTIVLKCTGSK